ncbi:dr1-associated corepressor isoform X1 [Hydra vulgaris]|uniref:dr1-associated corepressor isoform X1 n=1 Tax=Hydra vulgaris TaxID=6087 RepID=UPI001F5FBE6D|nr:dr1-associated corepressor [Hydra vulgaris]
MPSKKRKYEARFPPARIKKIMQTDEEIGKVAAAVPVIISRSLEIFLQSLVETTAKYTNDRKAKTMTTSHLKHCIENEGKFDFLKDLVVNIADIGNAEEEDSSEANEKPKRKKKGDGERKKRKKASSSDEGTDGENDDASQHKKQKMPRVVQPKSKQSRSLDSALSPTISLQSSSSSISFFQKTSNHSIESIMSRPHTPQPCIPSQSSMPKLSGHTVSALPAIMKLPLSQRVDDEDDDYDV